MGIELDRFLDEADVEELFDTLGLEYRRTSGGSDLNMQECPACKNDNWRTYFSTVKRRGICFSSSCAKRFNLFSFVRAQLGATPAGTIAFFENYSARSLGRRFAKPAATLRCEAAEWELPKSVPLPTPEGNTHPYLIERGILPRTQELFGLRWCEAGWFPFVNGRGEAKNMPFHGRIILPICDLNGTVKNFVGRDATGTAENRYLFPPSLPAAGGYLYGAELVRGQEHLVLGEGPFDAIAIHQAMEGHPDFFKHGAIGSFGLSIGHADPAGNDQLGRLRKLSAESLRTLTFLWDGEAGALAAALRSAEVISKSINGLAVRIGLLPAGKDPADVDSRLVRDAIHDARPYSQTLKTMLTLRPPYRPKQS